MKRKLIVTLVATALELYAASATAQVGSCTIAGTSKSAVAATPVTAGPLSPVTGFPEYVTDATGLSLQRCLDPDLCFFDPIVPSDPFSLQVGSGGESFWWGADAILSDQAGNAVFKLVMAAEAAFMQETPDGGLLDGSQFPFLRFRYVFDAPADGTYTLAHPYGTEKFDVVGATGNRDIFVSYDRGLTPGQTMTGNVGPFLQSVSQPAGFVGDVNVADLVTGGPCGNTVTLTGVATDGVTPIDFGGGQTSLSTDLFAVQGMIYDGRVQTPINAPRLTYSRSATAGGQVEAFAASTTAASVTVVDGPTIPVGSGRIAAATTLDHADVTPTDASAAEGINSLAVAVTDASALPPVVTMTASDTASLTTTGAQKFDPSSQNLKLVDFVDIAVADFDPASNTLTVSAASGDKRTNPALTVRGMGAIDPGTSLFTITTLAPPAMVHVDSAAGGTSTAQVRVVPAVAPGAPSLPVVGVATANTVALSWTDNADNEVGFRIYTVNPAGARTLVGTAPANATSGTATGLDISTTYTFQVEAFNGVGAASSETVIGTTLALPAAPATATVAASTSVQRRLDVSWDASADATDYQVYRRVGAGAPTLVATTTATTYAELNGTANTTYTFEVRARRTIAGITDLAATVTTTASLTTVAAPTSPLIGAVTVSGNAVTVNWTDRSSNEAGFQIFRRLGTGAYAPIGAVQDPTAGTGNARNFVDSPVAGGTYNYRVDVSNWAGTLQSGVSGNVIVVELNAPTNLSTVVNRRPTVNWTDNSVNESGYRLLRRTQTVNATTGLMTESAATTRTAGANARTYREPAQLATNLTLRYEVLALSGTTTGPSASVYVVTSNLPTAARPAAAVNGAGSLRVTWTASTVATVGGYELQRCAGATCTNFVKVNGTAVNTTGTVDGRSTNSFIDTGLTSGTTYRYRLRTVGGAGTSYVGPTFSAISVNRVAP